MYPARAGFLSLELEYGSSTIIILCSLILYSVVHMQAMTVTDVCGNNLYVL